MSVAVNILAATADQARPLVDGLCLRPRPSVLPFKLYASGDRSLRLIVSGNSSLAAATATRSLAGLDGSSSRCRPEAWLHVGLAIHPLLCDGDLALAHKVVDAVNGGCWYPPPMIGVARTLTVQTQAAHPSSPAASLPRCRPSDAVARDRVAAGFCRAAARHTLRELVHVAKILIRPDASTVGRRRGHAGANAGHPCPGAIDGHAESRVGRDTTAGLIGRHIDAVRTIVDELREIRRLASTADPGREYVESFIERWHFTRSQRHQLDGLLRRWAVLRVDRDPPIAAMSAARDAREALRLLRHVLDATPVRLAGS